MVSLVFWRQVVGMFCGVFCVVVGLEVKKGQPRPSFVADLAKGFLLKCI